MQLDIQSSKDNLSSMMLRPLLAMFMNKTKAGSALEDGAEVLVEVFGI